MSRFLSKNDTAKTLQMECSACGTVRTVAARDAKPQVLPQSVLDELDGPPIPTLTLACRCGAIAFVPLNDWRDGDLEPTAGAEMANYLHYYRGDAKPDSRVHLLDADSPEVETRLQERTKRDFGLEFVPDVAAKEEADARRAKGGAD